MARRACVRLDRRHLVSTLAVLVPNLVPLVGVLAFGWSLLEVVAYVWIEGVVLSVFACLEALPRLRARALFVVPLFLALAGTLLAFQALLLVLAFFVMRFQDDFWGVLDEGKRVIRGLAWGVSTLVAWHAVALAFAWRRPPRLARFVLGSAAAHVLLLTLFAVASVYVVRDLRAPALALVLLVFVKTGLEAGLAWGERVLGRASALPDHASSGM